MFTGAVAFKVQIIITCIHLALGHPQRWRLSFQIEAIEVGRGIAKWLRDVSLRQSVRSWGVSHGCFDLLDWFSFRYSVLYRMS